MSFIGEVDQENWKLSVKDYQMALNFDLKHDLSFFNSWRRHFYIN